MALSTWALLRLATIRIFNFSMQSICFIYEFSESVKITIEIYEFKMTVSEAHTVCFTILSIQRVIKATFLFDYKDVGTS